MTELATNLLYCGDNLDILRRYLPDASVDLIYLDPPFNSNRDYNVISRDKSGNATYGRVPTVPITETTTGSQGATVNREEVFLMHPNAELPQAHLDALALGDIAQAMSFDTDDVIFHYPGHNPLSGDYEGKDQVLALMGKVIQLTNGSFRPDVHDIVASADHVAALVTVHATRGGTPTEWQSVDLYHIRDGMISEHWVHEVDQALVDRFWSGTELDR